eukprot:Protomagalhaensia_wolfi_Nauph_80__5284@NODE_570_length_2273_cov_537_094897_g426_i0_p1_GENE_NODE_570_length_2273_cov_537_094897_g426_i0NODE_570_length_2273_cov_537_094897_g426_i0_p1_ORF_typecomplete_len288_score31_46_NODE_570_length_2273_cov_537_094897_g426_i0125988
MIFFFTGTRFGTMVGYSSWLFCLLLTADAIYTHTFGDEVSYLSNWRAPGCTIESSVCPLAQGGFNPLARADTISRCFDYSGNSCQMVTGFRGFTGPVGCASGQNVQIATVWNVMAEAFIVESLSVRVAGLYWPAGCESGEWWAELSHQDTQDCSVPLNITAATRLSVMSAQRTQITAGTVVHSLVFDMMPLIKTMVPGRIIPTIKLRNATPGCDFIDQPRPSTAPDSTFQGYKVHWGRNTTVTINKPRRVKGLVPRWRLERRLTTSSATVTITFTVLTSFLFGIALF